MMPPPSVSVCTATFCPCISSSEQVVLILLSRECGYLYRYNQIYSYLIYYLFQSSLLVCSLVYTCGGTIVALSCFGAKIYILSLALTEYYQIFIEITRYIPTWFIIYFSFHFLGVVWYMLVVALLLSTFSSRSISFFLFWRVLAPKFISCHQH